MDPPKIDSLISIGDGSSSSSSSSSSIQNPDADWLTFESCFNHPIYTKTNQQVQMGLFAIESHNVKVFVTRSMDGKTLAKLCKAFFPQFTPGDLLKKACGECDWQKDLGLQKVFVNLLSAEEVQASRDDNVLHLPTYAVLPYNYRDNIFGSITIGSKAKSEQGFNLWKLPQKWPMWHTTSRSCVVDISEVAPWPEPLVPISNAWWYAEEGDQPLGSGSHLTTERLGVCFSLKSGVEKVGSARMHGKKQTVGIDITYGGVQSDYIAVMNLIHHHRNNTDAHFRLMLEIFGIGERQNLGYGDGVLVRDLSCLLPDKRYLPAISIPYIGIDPRLSCTRYGHVHEPDWQKHWGLHFAKRFGRAKAMLLMRYGLQMETPNCQNYLIELEASEGGFLPTGCIVQRDLGDAQLIKTVFHAIHLKMQVGLDDEWSPANFKNPDIGAMYTLLKKHTTDAVSLKWFTFSALTRGSQLSSKSLVGTDPHVAEGDWGMVLCVMAQWGIEHARGFIECILENIPEAYAALDINACFQNFPDPNLFIELGKQKEQGISGAIKLDEAFQAWEQELDAVLMARLFTNHMVLDSMARWNWDIYEPPVYKPQPSTSSTSSSTEPHVNQADPERDDDEWD